MPGFEPGTMQDISAFAGQTLTNVEVRAGYDRCRHRPHRLAGRPGRGQLDRPRPPRRRRHADADAVRERRLHDSSRAGPPCRPSHRRAPAVDIVLADGSRPFTNLANPNEASAALPAGEIAGAKVAPTGSDPIADVPYVELQAGTDLIVYAVGSLEGGSLTFYTQTISGLGGAPTLVNTGDGMPGDGTSTTPIMLARSPCSCRRRRHRPRAAPPHIG